MANVQYADMLYQVRAETPGIPAPLIAAHYVQSVREHLSRSLAWRYSCPNLLDISAGIDWPTLVSGTDIPASTYVVQPVSVKWEDGTILDFKTRDQLDSIYGEWETRTASVPVYWTILSPGNWRIVPLTAADETESLRLRVALAPSINADSASSQIDEYLANEFQEAWAHGALARLLKIPGKDWTDVNAAQAHQNWYEDNIRDAKSRASAEYGRPSRQVVYGGLPIGRGIGNGTTGDYGQ